MNWKQCSALLQHAGNMGFRYVVFRIWYEFQRKTGLLKKRFPVNSNAWKFILLEDWKMLNTQFFFDRQSLDKIAGTIAPKDLETLKRSVEAIDANRYLFFNSVPYTVSGWHTNLETGYTYDSRAHWTTINDFSSDAGDIKYVWERSRFTFLYDLIRYDFHSQEDQAEKVFRQIESWIEMNPENCGPNWFCSQEIALRVLNWTFALHYYKNSALLSENRFQRIINSIYLQMKHVEENLSFSRIAVRNNHVLTEALGLFLTGIFYPFFPESRRWEEKGAKIFEQEIAFQVEPEGTYIQFSMNYHRVAVQLLSWAIRLAELNGRKWSDVIYQRAKASVYFLTSCQDSSTGWLPNYGNNDGTLFFPLTACYYRDFRPQLSALSSILGLKNGYGNGFWNEEQDWYFGFNKIKCTHNERLISDPVLLSFEKGGYYLAREQDTVTFLKCGSYSHRPFQTDNNHLDIWVKGENILRDAGTYQYNTEEKWLRYFSGTASHNTVMIGDFDQMRRGSRFIWYDWVKNGNGSCGKGTEGLILEGEFTGFRHLGPNIKHRRKVTKTRGTPHWTVEDWIENVPPGLPVYQIWHPCESFTGNYTIQAFQANRQEIPFTVSQGWYSESYGAKEAVNRLIFTTFERYIKTIISARPSF